MDTLGENEVLIEEESLVDYFEEYIGDDDTIIEFKINNIDIDDEDKYDILFNVKNYVMFGIGAKIKFSTAGLHVKGKNNVPHIHYHLVVEKCQKPQNPSDHRKRYIKKRLKDTENWTLGDISMKWHEKPFKDKPKYHVLSYPFKENTHIEEWAKNWQIDRGTPMKKSKISFLKEVGKTLYQNALAQNHRNDLCDERKKNKLLEIYDLVKNQEFCNFKEMLVWLDENYIAKLPLEQMPDFRNYKANCEKVATKIGILKYSHLFY